MKTRSILWAAAVLLAAVAPALAADQVKTTARERSIVLGAITKIDRFEIAIETTRGESRQIPVNEIVQIVFEDEPTALSAGRKQCNDGDYQQAKETLEKLNTAEMKRPDMVAEVQFLKANAATQLALAGEGEIKEAGRLLVDFVTNHDSSYRYLQACELLGNLLVANNSFDKATIYYQKLAEAPWADYKMRAGIAVGRTLLAQGKTAEAAKAFDEVAANPAADEMAEQQRLTAKVGKARCLVAASKADQAIAMLDDIIAKIDADNDDLHAMAYTAQGIALRKAGKAKEAMLAFLHVDLLYPTSPELHAESLFNLVELFGEMHNEHHARRMRETLKDSYPKSRWTQQLR